MRLKDKVAIVTGAASGMGAATARLFAREGAFVILTDMNDEDGQKVAREIGNRAQFVHHDVSKEDDWAKVVETTLKSHGKIDILINNAGVSGSDPDRFSMKTWDQQMDINAKGVFLGMRVPMLEGSCGEHGRGFSRNGCDHCEIEHARMDWKSQQLLRKCSCCDLRENRQARSYFQRSEPRGDDVDAPRQPAIPARLVEMMVKFMSNESIVDGNSAAPLLTESNVLSVVACTLAASVCSCFCAENFCLKKSLSIDLL